MPTQTRGFFSCDFCSAVLDTLDEATEHEAGCPKRPPQQASRQQGPAPYPSRYPPGGPHYGSMAPLSSAELERYGQTRHHYGTPHHEPLKLRALPLMGPERSPSLAPDDVVACQSIELFEAPPEIAADFDGSRTGGTPVVPKQVGIRCAHCATSNLASNYAIIFPASLGSIASNVRAIADHHLGTCQLVPPEIRQICKSASKRRQEMDRREGRNASDDDERSRMALVDYCVGFCQHWGIVNKQPFKGGIAFADLEMPPTPADTPSGHRGHPSGMYSGERMGPPMSYDRMGYPPMRPGMPPMMGGPGEAIAPTPLQRRREAPAYSADRSEGGPNSAGYPTPYGEGGYGRGVQTPQQPNFEGKDGPTPRSAPPSAHPSESSPGYNHYDLPHNFPYYQENDRTWHCKFCSHVHPAYRDPQAIWSSPSGGPPPGSFIDAHLSMCRGYHQSIPSPPGAYGGPPPGYGMPPPYMGGYPPQMPPPHHPAWEGAHGSPSSGMMPPYPPHGPPPPDHQYPYAPAPPAPPGEMSHLLVGPDAGMARNAPPPRKPDGDAIRGAIAHLTARESEYYARSPSASKADRLVLEDDKLLLTDYFFFLMKQLRLCRFSESDRKTRGGKREKIKIGYGGLQCVHCADIPNSRKFFWSNVDRLANSFAEIPGHVLKCRRCPMQTKDALLQLKQFHPEQMARLPRGSQKVFFRRMWRRLHDDDGTAEANATAADGDASVADSKAESDSESKVEKETTPRNESPSGKTEQEKSPTPVGNSDESLLVIQRSTLEAAKTLAEATNQPEGSPYSPSSRVLLAIQDDKEWLSDSDCYVRKQLEVFCATEADVTSARTDRKYPIRVGQVGIRCLHCAMATKGLVTGTAVAFPFALTGIYEAVREFQRLHLDSCENLPESASEKLAGFKGAASLSSVLRKYYVLAAKALGLQDTRDGIRAGGDAAPLGSQAAFSFAEGGVSLTKDEKNRASPSAASMEDKEDVNSSEEKVSTVSKADENADDKPTTKVEAVEEDHKVDDKSTTKLEAESSPNKTGDGPGDKKREAEELEDADEEPITKKARKDEAVTDKDASKPPAEEAITEAV